jgi:putative colanic acid biosynthesis glycosyltransferase
MSRPLISIVTVTLNCAEDAVRTAQSVLGQTAGDYEYLVKDGGSSDGTPERLRELGVAVESSPDTGIYDAMNQALAHCNGEYVYFLNAGDTFASPTVLAELEAGIDREAAIVYGELMLWPMGKRTKHPRRLTRSYLFRKNMNHQAWLARRDLYLTLGGLGTTYRFCADQELFWRAALERRLPTQHLDIVIANFVYGGVSTRRSSVEQVAAERRALERRFFRPWEIALYGARGLFFLNPLKRRIWYMLYPSTA